MGFKGCTAYRNARMACTENSIQLKTETAGPGSSRSKMPTAVAKMVAKEREALRAAVFNMGRHPLRLLSNAWGQTQVSGAVQSPLRQPWLQFGWQIEGSPSTAGTNPSRQLHCSGAEQVPFTQSNWQLGRHKWVKLTLSGM